MLVGACRTAFSLRCAAAPARALHATSSLAAAPTPKKLVQQQLRDEAIRPRLVRLVQDGPEENGLGPLVPRDSVLGTLDRNQNWLLQVDEQELGEEAARARRLPPASKIAICKIVNKKEQFQKNKDRTAAAKEKKQSNKREEKEFQLTWGVALNDLQHKLKRAQQTLDKGGRAALVITSPRGTKAPPQADRQMFASMVKDQLGLNTGKASVWKAEEWRGSRAALYLEGVKPAT